MTSKIAWKVFASGIFIGLLIAVGFLGTPEEAVAKKILKEIKGMNYSVDSHIPDNLKALKGKQVSLVLVSGKTFTGLVKEIGPHLIHLEKLKSKEYYDALIRLSDVCAIEAMFRKYER